MNAKKIILTIGGSDPSGGAGIQADIKTFDRLQFFACSVITAITAQNSSEFSNIWPLDVNQIASQLDSVLNDCTPAAVKIGLLCSPEAIKIIASKIIEHNLTTVVVDPVLSPTLKDYVPDKDLVNAYIEHLFPISTLITPNEKEKQTLEEVSGRPLEELAEAFLIKGGDKTGKVVSDILYFKESVADPMQLPSTTFPTINFGNSGLYHYGDILINPDTNEKFEIIEFKNKRIDSTNTHGSGCILSSAIACYMAKGYNLAKAVELGIKFTNEAIRNSSGLTLFKGNYGPALT